MPKLHFPPQVRWQEEVADDISHPSTDLTSLSDSTPPLSHSLFIIARRGKWAFVIITQGESWMKVVQPRREEGRELYFGKKKIYYFFLSWARKGGEEPLQEMRASTGNMERELGSLVL